MKNHINRREFINRSIAASVGAVTASISFPSVLFGNQSAPGIDISAVSGTEYFNNTMKAVELLGGIVKFVPKGSMVGMLVNSPWDRPGTYTNPDIVLAVMRMCLDAGAKEIYSIEDASKSYWKRSALYKKFESEVNEIKSNSDKKTVAIVKGKALKQADISKILLECNVLINVPITKHHRGVQLTGNLKNMMGACSGSTNRFFHKGSGKGGLFSYYDDSEFLSQCIADVNLIRKPDLCIVDATEFITTNGPAGPGNMAKPQKIIAGTNCLSVDAYCATLHNVNPADILTLQYAYQHGVGEIDLKKLVIKEV
jgi:uncharacterized protein (DUF362 family)